jgi:hypothetical protein
LSPDLNVDTATNTSSVQTEKIFKKVLF